MKKFIPFIISALALTACGASGSEISYEQLTMYKALSQMAKEENYVLLDVRTIEDVCEPYLLQAGLLQRTPRGRKVSPEGYRHLGLKQPSEQKTLFDF